MATKPIYARVLLTQFAKQGAAMGIVILAEIVPAMLLSLAMFELKLMGVW